MRRTFPKVTSNRRAFTLLELMIVVTLIAMCIAIVVPRFAPVRQSAETRRFYSEARALFVSARENAITEGTQHIVRIGDNSSLEELIPAADGSGAMQTVQTLALPTGITWGDAKVQTNSVDAAGWQMSFQPDGTCLGGGIEFQENGQTTRSFQIDSKTGNVTVYTTNLPDTSSDVWPAGEYEKRF